MDFTDNYAAKRIARGFTLIELLVVVAIIALLMAISLPALSHARDQANSTKCKTNLAALSKALMIYAFEWDNVVPVNGTIMPKVPTGGTTGIPKRYQSGSALGQLPFTDLNTNDAVPSYGALWKEMHGIVNPPGTGVATFIGNIRKAYVCPSDDLQRTNQTGGPTNQALVLASDNYQVGLSGINAGSGYFSYSVNTVLNSLGRFRDQFSGTDSSGNPVAGAGTYADLASFALPWSDPLKITSIRNPSQFICFIEEDDGSQFNDEIVEPPAFAPTTNKLTNRHFGSGNLGFGDAHVESVQATRFNIASGVSPPSTTANAMQILMTRGFFPDNGAFSDNGP